MILRFIPQQTKAIYVQIFMTWLGWIEVKNVFKEILM